MRQANQALGKPVGSYRTLDLTAFWQRGDGFFDRAVQAGGAAAPGAAAGAGDRSGSWIGKSGHDAGRRRVRWQRIAFLSPGTCSPHSPSSFPASAAVAALRPGVLGTTGIEAAEAVLSLTERLQPAAVIAVDALASRRTERVCAALQLATRIVPGSGVGNHRAALNRTRWACRVIAVGVSTVDRRRHAGGRPVRSCRNRGHRPGAAAKRPTGTHGHTPGHRPSGAGARQGHRLRHQLGLAGLGN